jgi:hypothetical protein
MTQIAADAHIGLARERYAVPAREKTKQTYAQSIGGFVLGCGALYVAAQRLSGTHLAWVLVGVVGIFAAGPAARQIVEALRKKAD